MSGRWSSCQYIVAPTLILVLLHLSVIKRVCCVLVHQEKKDNPSLIREGGLVKACCTCTFQLYYCFLTD